MTEKSINLLGLMELIRSEALPKDWNQQRARGERKRAFSRSSFDDAMFDKRPEIGTATFFKKVYNYSRHNKTVKRERGIGEVEVLSFLHYIYKDIPTKYGWPEVEDAFKNYNSGEFADLISEYQQDFKATPGVESGDAYSDTLHMQIVKMAIEAKTRYSTMKKEGETAKSENKVLRDKLKQKEDVLIRVRERIATLETLISNRSGNKDQLLKELKEIKQKYF